MSWWDSTLILDNSIELHLETWAKIDISCAHDEKDGIVSLQQVAPRNFFSCSGSRSQESNGNKKQNSSLPSLVAWEKPSWDCAICFIRQWFERIKTNLMCFVTRNIPIRREYYSIGRFKRRVFGRGRYSFIWVPDRATCIYSVHNLVVTSQWKVLTD